MILTEKIIRLLPNMKRKRLQQLCKHFNIPANIKNDDIIKKLTDIYNVQNNPIPKPEKNNSFHNSRYVKYSKLYFDIYGQVRTQPLPFYERKKIPSI